MSTQNDGGPAFPFDWVDFQPTTGDQVVREQFPGMSLRDYFAGQALPSVLRDNDQVSKVATSAGITFTYAAAIISYGIADDMLEARSK